LPGKKAASCFGGGGYEYGLYEKEGFFFAAKFSKKRGRDFSQTKRRGGLKSSSSGVRLKSGDEEKTPLRHAEGGDRVHAKKGRKLFLIGIHA